MKELELRLGVVCYGGVSLAVYMHGVTKEILKLARASKAYHSVRDRSARRDLSYRDVSQPPSGEHCDTEAVYFDFVKAVSDRLDLRVVVDVLSGASAGGINAVILGRALAHDLPIEGLRRVWLREADIDRLLTPKHRPRFWSKWFMRPLVWGLAKGRLAQTFGTRQARAKLSTFVRSRWFKPPFSGVNLSTILFDAIDGMGEPRRPGDSLLPESQKLDLFVAVTDFFGYPQRIRIHDPPFVSEREHRHVLRFEAYRRSDGAMVSDFDRAGVPALVFAARATSSFPGAFPPAQLAEMERVLTAKGMEWTCRDLFLERNFPEYYRAGLDPAKTSFIDGSVLNNKPFAEAIHAIRDRPAFRQVDRRLIFIDPDPGLPPPPPDGGVPGFFRTLKGALSDIPRNEPIHNELSWIEDHNAQIRRIRTIIEAARADIGGMVAGVTESQLERPVTHLQLARWRDAANSQAVNSAGFVFDGYLRLKLMSVLDFVSETLRVRCGLAAGSIDAQNLVDILDDWARSAAIHPETAVVGSSRSANGDSRPAWIDFLLNFDLGFRERRLRFVIRQLNQIYSRLHEPAFADLSTDTLDAFKTRLYHVLGRLAQYDDPAFVSSDCAARIRRILQTIAVSGSDTCANDTLKADFGVIVRDLSGEIDLAGINASIDDLFASMSPAEWCAAARRELLIAYIGFAFWDVVLFSLTNWRNLGEFDEIRVDRISPLDAKTLLVGGNSTALKGIHLGHFGAFFNYAHREHDYLWGRLHAVDRLFDVLHDAAAREGLAAGPNIKDFKKRAFEEILRCEKNCLTECEDLFASLEAAVAAL